VQARSVVALPAEVRRRLHLDEPGAQAEITERDDGVLELRPALPVAADQRWFWTKRRQEREREVPTGQISPGRTRDLRNDVVVRQPRRPGQIGARDNAG